VDERNVDAVGTQPPQAALQRCESAIPAEIAHTRQFGRAVEAFRALDITGRGHQPTADLGRQDKFLARSPGHEMPNTLLRQADAVMRCGVEGTDARRPRRTQGRRGLIVSDRGVEAADRAPPKIISETGSPVLPSRT
jgi:hypothetical protein